MASQALMGQSGPSFDAKKILPTPNYLDLIVVEVLSRKLENYAEVVYGTPHPDTTLFPSHRLVFQVQQTEELTVRYYAADRANQDLYNFGISYEAESNAHPTYTRDYIVRRSEYAPLPKLATLAGLFRATVTAAGTGYTQATTTASLAGGTGSGGAVTPIVNNGAVIGLVITARGNYSAAPAVTINTTAGGAGATGTVAIQGDLLLLVKEDMAQKTGDERIDSLYVLVRRVYQTLPGPQLIGHERSVAVRGRTVDIDTQKGASGNIPIQTGDLIISSVLTALSTTVDEVTTKSIGSLPPDEVSAFWDFVGLPTLLFDIVNTIYCNDSQFATLVTNPVKGGGSAVIRKHRKTVSYSSTVPDPDLSGAAYVTADIEYRGKMIQFAYQNVLNDAISYSEALALTSGGSACAWTEAYTFSATTPSATDFAAGMWLTKSFLVEPFGDSMWKSTLIEFYSAAGNPSL